MFRQARLFFRRMGSRDCQFSDFTGLVDPVSVYTPVDLLDVGPEGRPNTSDDSGLLNVFALTNPGNEFDLYSNPPGAFNRYDAVQVVGRKRYARDWRLHPLTPGRKIGERSAIGHVNAARFDLGRPGTFVNPNFSINAFGPCDVRPHA